MPPPGVAYPETPSPETDSPTGAVPEETVVPVASPIPRASGQVVVPGTARVGDLDPEVRCECSGGAAEGRLHPRYNLKSHLQASSQYQDYFTY